MGSLPEMRIARQAIYLQSLAETGSVTEAAQAAHVDISLPAHWRLRYPAFALAERKAKQTAGQKLVQAAQMPREPMGDSCPP